MALWPIRLANSISSNCYTLTYTELKEIEWMDWYGSSIVLEGTLEDKLMDSFQLYLAMLLN